MDVMEFGSIRRKKVLQVIVCPYLFVGDVFNNSKKL